MDSTLVVNHPLDKALNKETIQYLASSQALEDLLLHPDGSPREILVLIMKEHLRGPLSKTLKYSGTEDRLPLSKPECMDWRRSEEKLEKFWRDIEQYCSMYIVKGTTQGMFSEGVLNILRYEARPLKTDEWQQIEAWREEKRKGRARGSPIKKVQSPITQRLSPADFRRKFGDIPPPQYGPGIDRVPRVIFPEPTQKSKTRGRARPPIEPEEPEPAPAPAQEDDKPKIALKRQNYRLMDILFNASDAEAPQTIKWDRIVKLFLDIGFVVATRRGGGARRAFKPGQELVEIQVSHVLWWASWSSLLRLRNGKPYST